MDTNELLTKAEEKLEETKKQFESDEKKLSQLIEKKGNLEADELIESRPEQIQEIKKMKKEIKELKDLNEGYSPVIDGLKRRILSLKSKLEKETIEKAKAEQDELEKKLEILSKRIIPELKKIQGLNSELKIHWADWSRLDSISGKGLTNRKCLKNSQGMLDLVCSVLLNEWAGQSDGETRKFYSKDNWHNTHLIF